MRKYLQILLSLSFATTLFAAKNDAYQKKPLHAPTFESDYVCFKAPSARTYVEIYNQIPFSQLCFQRVSMQKYIAVATLDITLTKKKIEFAHTTRTDTLNVNTFEKTLTSRQVLSCLQSYIIDAGDYNCKVSVTDLVTGKKAVKKFNMQVPEYRSTSLRLSEVQFASRITNAEGNGPFVKSGLYVVPNPQAEYGYFTTHIPVYYEIYNIPLERDNSDKFLNMEFILIAKSDGAVVKQIKLGAYFRARDCIQSALLPAYNLDPGKYKLQIVVSDPRSRSKSMTEREFSVGNEVVLNPELTIDDLINQMAFIAKESEMTQLRYLKPEKKRQAMLRFWAAKDPTPETPENENMLEYFRRLDFVNQIFSTPEQRGWETEAGRIYMQFGPPDRISHGRYLNQQKPCEIWTYKNLKCRYFLLSGNEVVKFRL